MLAKDKLFNVDLSKLSNLGTYQEIGKGYEENATERNSTSKILFALCLTVNERSTDRTFLVNVTF